MYSVLFISIAISIILHHLLNLLRRGRPLPPGPKPWPLIGNLPHLGSMPHQSLAALARVHGPLMFIKLGFVDAVVATSASMAAACLKAHDANFSNRPPNSGAKHIAYNYHDLVFAPYGPRWRMLRKICSVHLFSGKALDDTRHVRHEEVAELTRALANAGTKAVDLGQKLNLCSANILGRVMIGRTVFGDGSSDKAKVEFKEMVVELMTLAGQFNISDFVPAIEWMDLQGIASKMKNVHKRFDAFLTKIVDDHKNNVNRSGSPGEHKDMLSTLLLLKDQPSDDRIKLTDVEIKALLLNIFAAGTDTSSSTTEWAIAELIRHPKVMAKVQEELDAVVGRDRIVNELDLPKLTYFQAVVKETFRLHPATPLNLPRIAAESCEVNGYHIPKGSTLFVNIWAIGRDPEEWTNPLEFRPERFLPGGEKAHVNVYGNHFEVMPFGSGRRICAGMNLGYRMVQLVTATFVHAFDWELPNGIMPEKLNMDEAFGISLQRAVPLMLHPRPRLSPHVY